jgi:cysteine desulfurase
MIYLDNSATTKPYPEVVRLVSAVMDDCYGNPSSLHSVGLEAERAVREASRRIRRCLGGQETQLVFTSGGTESDNLAILGAASALGRRGRRVVTSLVEHPAVTEAMNKLESMGFEVIRVHVDKAGRIDLDRLGEAVNPDTVLISGQSSPSTKSTASRARRCSTRMRSNPLAKSPFRRARRTSSP